MLADIRDKVDQAQADLPADADEPGVFETNLALEPTIIVTLSGDVPERTLVRRANDLADEIEAISSVREVNVQGGRDEVLEVVLDLERLESYDITQRELLDAIHAQTTSSLPPDSSTPAPAASRSRCRASSRTRSTSMASPSSRTGEAVVTLGDVAELRRTFADPSTFTRVNGQPAVSLEVVKRIGTNIIENNAEVRSRHRGVHGRMAGLDPGWLPARPILVHLRGAGLAAVLDHDGDRARARVGHRGAGRALGAAGRASPCPARS